MTRVIAGLLLAAPVVLAFMSGGFFARPTLAAGVIAWMAVAVVMLTAPQPLPRSPRALAALGGLAALVGWTALSVTWAPDADQALADAERSALYLAVLVCAVAVLRGRPVLRAVEPALAAGAVVVIGYAMLTRFLPGLVPSERSVSAGGRLEQPLTYWNAVGVVAAMGAVLLMRLALDHERGARTRLAAAAATPLMLLALWMTVSRGSLAALGVGVAALLLLERDWRAVRLVAILIGIAGLAVLLTRNLIAFQDLRGTAADRREQGLVALGVTMAACAGAAYAQALQTGRRLGRSARLAMGALALTAIAAAGAYQTTVEEPEQRIVFPSGGPTGSALPTDAQRLRSLQSNRYRYWEVARDGFQEQPLLGQGAHGFATLWLGRRPINEPVQDAHSLYFETAAELGLPGLLFLFTFLGGAAVCALRVWRRDRVAATGWIAAGAVWLVHAGIDWDWEMPAVTLPFLILCGAAMAAEDARE